MDIQCLKGRWTQFLRSCFSAFFTPTSTKRIQRWTSRPRRSLHLAASHPEVLTPLRASGLFGQGGHRQYGLPVHPSAHEPRLARNVERGETYLWCLSKTIASVGRRCLALMFTPRTWVEHVAEKAAGTKTFRNSSTHFLVWMLQVCSLATLYQYVSFVEQALIMFTSQFRKD